MVSRQLIPAQIPNRWCAKALIPAQPAHLTCGSAASENTEIDENAINEEREQAMIDDIWK